MNYPIESTADAALTFHFLADPVRVVWRDDEPWFVAADVAKALDYRMASDMTRWLDDDEKGTHSVRTKGGRQDMAVINEPGLYSAVLKSRKPEAKAFKRWVRTDVLPALRRHGVYSMPGSLGLPSPGESGRELSRANARVAELERALLKAQGAQIRLHQRLGSSVRRLEAAAAIRTVIEMERRGEPRERMVLLTGRTATHVRVILHRARAAGLLPPVEGGAGPTAAAAGATQGTLFDQAGAAGAAHG